MKNQFRYVAGSTAIGLVSVLAGCLSIPPLTFDPAFKDAAFVNWETPHVSPLALSSDGARLFAVNTPDNRLEVFDVTGDVPVLIDSIPVGLEPVSVRMRNDNEAWVANHLSDSISIVDLVQGVVVKTLHPGDEPTDIAFAGIRAFVVCSQLNQVKAYSLLNLDGDPVTIDIAGEDPRAAAVSPDGRKVYVTIFESGNHTTLVRWEDVSDPSGPYNGQNPAPNMGDQFFPPRNPDLPPAPPVSMIVRKDITDNTWRDDNGRDWSQFITWDQHDHDLAVIDAETLDVDYVSGIMTTNMHLTVDVNDNILVVGTEATNEVRFEPNLTGKFVRSVMAFVDPDSPGELNPVDLNPHLADAYEQGLSNIDQTLRDQSLADPRGVAIRSDGSRTYITGMGSNNVRVLGGVGEPAMSIDVGQGPTGLALDEASERLYVLNKFDATISVIDTTLHEVVATAAMHDPTPAVIKDGRPFLYDARAFSGLGVTACAACHVDARVDHLAWDLGDPSGAMKGFNQDCNRPFLDLPVGECEDWHPMKGPMTTQTFQGIVGTEPFHWRGDREDLAAFNPAFVGLLGADRQLTNEQMQAFEDFIATIVFPPNPNRNMDNSLKTRVGDGDPKSGEFMFFNKAIDLGFAKCQDCHDALARGAGTNHAITPRNLLINPHQSIDVPQIRNIHEKSSFARDRMDNNFGFGHNHDGTIDGLVNFFHIPNFTGFDKGERGEQQRRDIIAFVFSFATDTHAGVGTQVTLSPANHLDGNVAFRLTQLERLAETGEVGLVAKGIYGGERRGFVYTGGGLYAPDRMDDPLLPTDTLRDASTGNVLTWTVVPIGTETRIGIDRDNDGVLDSDD